MVGNALIDQAAGKRIPQFCDRHDFVLTGHRDSYKSGKNPMGRFRYLPWEFDFKKMGTVVP